MKITDEKIERAAQDFFSAPTDEKREAAKSKLIDMCIRYLNKCTEDTGEDTDKLMENMLDANESVYRGEKGYVYFDNVVFVETFNAVCKGYEVSKGAFLHYFRHIYAQRMQGKIADKYVEKSGIRLKSADSKRLRELNRLIKDYAGINVNFAHQSVKTISQEELHELCLYYYGDDKKILGELKSIWLYFCRMRTDSVDLQVEAADGSRSALAEIIPDKDAYEEMWREERLRVLAGIFHEVYNEATDIQKKYFACFNCVYAVRLDSLQSLLAGCDFVQWDLLEFVASERGVSPSEVVEISNADIARYTGVLRGTITKQREKYDAAVQARKSLLYDG